MGAKWLVVIYGLIQIILLSNVTYCLRLDHSGWRTVEQVSPSLYRNNQQQLDENNNNNNNNNSSKQQIQVKGVIKKLVEWDDDDLVNNLNDLVDFPARRRPQQEIKKETLNSLHEIDNKSKIYKSSSRQKSKTNRLIYHGQISNPSSAIKFVDGIRMKIDLRQPVTINRRRPNPILDDKFTTTTINHLSTSNWMPENELNERLLNVNVNHSNARESFVLNKIPDYLDTLRSSSDWKPITATQVIRRRRSKENQLKNRVETSTGNNNLENATEIIKTSLERVDMESNQKWTPIFVFPSSPTKKMINDELGKKKLNLFKTNSRPKTKMEARKMESVVYGKKMPEDHLKFEHISSSNLNEPFDEDDGIITARKDVRFDRLKEELDKTREPKLMKNIKAIEKSNQQLTAKSSLLRKAEIEVEPNFDSETNHMKLKKYSENKWRPVNLITTTTEQQPTTTISSLISSRADLNSSVPEAAHKSASDINYIYSQPATQNQDFFRQPVQSASSNYYANYLVPQQPAPSTQMIPEQQTPQTIIEQPIIDTTSGQVPEMIADRIPDSPISAIPSLPSTDSGYTYSMPQTSNTAFQPIQTPTPPPPPARDQNPPPPPPPSPHYNYYQPQIPQPQAAPLAQPLRQPLAPAPMHPQAYGSYQQPSVQATQPPQTAPQVVRQEHHYHYYNQPSTQQPSRSSSFQSERQFQPTSTQQPIQSVIREVQPVFISQPIIQQPIAAATTTTSTTTTTPAPQIIREIIKEVPLQTMQQMPTRITLPTQTQTFAFIPAIAKEQLDSVSLMQSYAASLAAPAQRVIRQISSSIPQVSVRMPASVVPQMKLQNTLQQAFQFPARLATATSTSQATTAQQQVGQSVTRQTASFVIPPMPKKTTTYLTETQAMPTHTTIMHTTQFTPATRTTVYTTDHQTQPIRSTLASGNGYRKRR